MPFEVRIHLSVRRALRDLRFKPDFEQLVRRRMIDDLQTAQELFGHRVSSAGGDEAEVDGRRQRSALAGTEQPVVAADGNMFHFPLRLVIVDVEPAVVGVRSPAAERAVNNTGRRE